MKIYNLLLTALAVLAATSEPLLANGERWSKEEREQKCEKVIQAKIISIQKESDFNRHEELVVATLEEVKITKDNKPSVLLKNGLKVYFLRPKPGVVMRDGSHPLITKDATYFLYLTRFEELGNLKSILFIELAGDAIPSEPPKK